MASVPKKLTAVEANEQTMLALAVGPMSFEEIVRRLFGEPAPNGAYAGDWRAIDRALQRLRKRGAVRYTRRVWEIVPQ